MGIVYRHEGAQAGVDTRSAQWGHADMQTICRSTQTNATQKNPCEISEL